MKSVMTVGFCCVALVFAGGVWAADTVSSKAPTFTKDVLPILQENCQTCHRPFGANLAGMIAPMSLLTYQEVRPWAKAIAKAVREREMPPWDATDATHGVFRNERTLTDTQIETIVAWVARGAIRGNPADAPEPIPLPKAGWSFGEPDLIVGFDEPFFVDDDVQDLYQDVFVDVSEEKLPQDRWIQAVEFRSGSEAVHHLIGHAWVPSEGVEEENRRSMFGGIAPGSDRTDWEDGYGVLLKKGSRVRFELHYHKEAGPGTGVWDSSAVAFQFHEKPVTHPITFDEDFYSDAFEVPPGQSDWKVGAIHNVEVDTWLLGMLPHMHLRGSAARYKACYPDGTSEILLDVPQYDFNWQTWYKYQEKKYLPKGTRLEVEMWFDNSDERALEAGFDSKRPVAYGGPTTDEMAVAWIMTAPVEPVETDVSGARE